MSFWIDLCGGPGKAPGDLALTLAASLGALWRLYYDHRISPVHTVTETFEATFIDPVITKKPELAPYVKLSGRPKDEFEFVLECAKLCGTPGSLSPIVLMNMLRLGAKETSYDGLKDLVNQERQQLSLTAWVPQWSHETGIVAINEKTMQAIGAKEPATSTRVRTFNRPLTVIASYLGPDADEFDDLLKSEAFKLIAMPLVEKALARGGKKQNKEHQ